MSGKRMEGEYGSRGCLMVARGVTNKSTKLLLKRRVSCLPTAKCNGVPIGPRSSLGVPGSGLNHRTSFIERNIDSRTSFYRGSITYVSHNRFLLLHCVLALLLK